MCSSELTKIALRSQLINLMEKPSATRKNHPHSSFLIFIPILIITLHYHYVSTYYHYVSTVSIITITSKSTRKIHFTWQMICQQWPVLCELHWPFYEFAFLTVDVLFAQKELSQSTPLYHETYIYHRHFKVRIFFMLSWLLWQL